MKISLGPKTISCPTPVFVIGSYDKQGKANMMTVAWGGICCSNPPCLAISLRKATHSYQNIIEQQAFTVNIPSEEQIALADYVGMVSGRDVDKFAALDLTPIPSDLVNAPLVKEFPLVIECSVLQSVVIGSHTQFIGEIKDVKVNDNLCGENGLPDITLLKPAAFAPGNQGYFAIGRFLGKAFSIGNQAREEC